MQKMNKLSIWIVLSMVLIVGYNLVQKDIQTIRNNPDQYSAYTTPYETGITFTLSNEQIRKGITEPRLLEKVHDTNVSLIEVYERGNHNGKYVIVIGLEDEYHSLGGTMLAMFRLNPDQSSSRTVTYEVFNEDGKNVDVAHGGGDGEAPYNQSYHYELLEEDLLMGETWTFKVSGLHLLHYGKY
ncbi:hypothetical protein H0266_14855 [Halobacillus locisalis]|uniref:Uncharacterized protein n=1 Tax=Halobacillus locisalis TaxID=220753 RepID=A0A838CW71_9BACI|nr:hypothetical protein [Halobacillus locisalis]MBA2176174.1 hypothetical protein [Halobacillus locisalis]